MRKKTKMNHTAVRCIINSLCLAIYFPLYSCSGANDSLSTNSHHEVTDTLIGKEVLFYEGLQFLDSSQNVGLDSIKMFTEPKNKIVSIIDATCPKCVHSIALLDSLVRSYNASIPIIYVLNTDDIASFYKYTRPSIKSDSFFLIDTAYIFESKNNLLLEDVRRRTFLLDTSNRIRIAGNPAFLQGKLAEYQNF